MSEYKDPIQITANDPICSVSALNGTVIGILFEKKGSDIQMAIEKRVKLIDSKTEEYEAVIKDADQFLRKKEKEIEELDEVYRARSDKKRSEMKPFERELEDIKKKMDHSVFVFDKETEKTVAQKAVGFEEGFEKFEKTFDEIDNLLDMEKRKSAIILKSMGNTGIGTTGSRGSLGIQRDMGSPGDTGSEGIYTITSGVSINNNASNEDKALARLNTLREIVREYTGKIQRIMAKINELKEEKRRLSLISQHVSKDREYKLDLNKLSAFGFEDIEVVD